MDKRGERKLGNHIDIKKGTSQGRSWLFFGINEKKQHKEKDTHKAYVSLKDISAFTEENILDFMKFLQNSGYVGGLKIPQDFHSQIVGLNDQIVMHGEDEKQAKLGEDLARKFFGDNIANASLGKDSVIDGKNRSYSQILGMYIKEKVQKGK
jgi:hypothetical protein